MNSRVMQGCDGTDFPFVLVDSTGAIILSAAGGGTEPASYDSAIDAASGIILAAPCTILELHGYNSAGADRYFQLFNAVAVPADGATPAMMPVRVPAGEHFSLTFCAGRRFSTGCCWCSSTTRATKTLTGAPDMTINAQRRP